MPHETAAIELRQRHPRELAALDEPVERELQRDVGAGDRARSACRRRPRARRSRGRRCASPSASRSITARSERPIRRWISTVRPSGRPAGRVARLAARRSSAGSIPYSAVSQPRPEPSRQRRHARRPARPCRSRASRRSRSAPSRPRCARSRARSRPVAARRPRGRRRGRPPPIASPGPRSPAHRAAGGCHGRRVCADRRLSSGPCSRPRRSSSGSASRAAGPRRTASTSSPRSRRPSQRDQRDQRDVLDRSLSALAGPPASCLVVPQSNLLACRCARSSISRRRRAAPDAIAKRSGRNREKKWTGPESPGYSRFTSPAGGHEVR